MNNIFIVTTASLPWRTGTSVNAMNRATCLSTMGYDVTLMLPWISTKKQINVFDTLFNTKNELVQYIKENHSSSKNIDISFYNAKLYIANGQPSIYPAERIDKLIPKSRTIILEEPEHLLWTQPFQNFKSKSSNVIGIIHTNYSYYIRKFGYKKTAKILNIYSKYLIKKKCDKVIHLSEATRQEYSYGVVSPAHGVREEFLNQEKENSYENNDIYFMGKIIWEKGFKELVDLLDFSQKNHSIDCYGDDFQGKEILQYADSNNVKLNIYPSVPNPATHLKKYKIFINPSQSEVLCTTTLEAIAMGKWVIIPDHISNQYFSQFKNVLTYSGPEQFKAQLQKACDLQPKNDPQVKELDWKQVTQRYLANAV